MSFYVTLASNVINEHHSFIQNNIFLTDSTTEFKTIFESPIKLDRPYEVALVEFSYKHTWKINIGKIRITLQPYSNMLDMDKDICLTREFDIDLLDGENIKDLFEQLNDKIRDDYKKAIYNLRYKEFERLIALDPKTRAVIGVITNHPYGPNFPLDLELWSRLNSHPAVVALPKFSIDEKNNFGININSKIKLEITGMICKILSIELPYVYEDEYENLTLEPHHLSDITPKLIQTIYLYTDIVDYQIVGNKRAPLLRHIVVDSEYRKVTNLFFENPYYVKVNKTCINSIDLVLRDEVGEKIKFFDGSVVAVLHFRPIN